MLAETGCQNRTEDRPHPNERHDDDLSFHPRPIFTSDFNFASAFDPSNVFRYSRFMTRHWSLTRQITTIGFSLLAFSCGPAGVEVVTAPTIIPPPGPTANPQSTPPAIAPSAPHEPEKLAILPIEDEKLFRSERAVLRFELAGHLARVLRDRTIVPLAEVDAKIRPVSPATGHVCAYERGDIEQRARYKGWEHTRIMHVGGIGPDQGEQLWVQVVEGIATVGTFIGPWNAKVPRIDAYRGAFAALVRNDNAGVLGGLGASGSDIGAAREGGVTVCEAKFFGACDASSIDWQDKAGALATCFAGVDDTTRELLIQGDVGPYCEMENLDYPDGREAKLEACLCKILGTSTAMVKRPGRRTIRVRYESPDLAGKTRPEVRVIETSTNIEARDDWHSVVTMVAGKKQYNSVRRLEIDNIDVLADPLSRCVVPAGTMLLADVDIREDGYPVGAKVLTSGLDKQVQTCVEQNLTHGSFYCTNDGKSAKVRVAVEWRAP